MLMYECDGCGKIDRTTVASHPTNKIQLVGVNITSAKGQGTVEFHLCEGCENHLRENANPKKWPRPAKDAA